MKIGICDDCAADGEFLKDTAEEWAGNRGISLDTELFSSVDSFLSHYAEHKAYDILLMAVNMGSMEGITLAKTIRWGNETVQIVFLVCSPECVASGHEVEALTYLVRPVSRETLCTTLDRSAEKLRKDEKCLRLTLSLETVQLPIYQIRYVDMQRNRVTVHAMENYTLRQSMNSFAKELDDRFYRAGRDLILNLDMIRRVTRVVVHLTDGTLLHLPEEAYEGLNNALAERT